VDAATRGRHIHTYHYEVAACGDKGLAQWRYALSSKSEFTVQTSITIIDPARHAGHLASLRYKLFVFGFLILSVGATLASHRCAPWSAPLLMRWSRAAISASYSSRSRLVGLVLLGGIVDLAARFAIQLLGPASLVMPARNSISACWQKPDLPQSPARR